MELETKIDDIDLNKIEFKIDPSLNLELLNNQFNNIMKINNNNQCYLFFDGKMFKKEYNNDIFVSYLFLMIDKAIDLSKDKQIILILDLFNLKKKDVHMNMLFKIIKNFRLKNKIYRDIFKKIVVINYNKTMKFLYNIIKIFINKKVKKIIEFKNMSN